MYSIEDNIITIIKGDSANLEFKLPNITLVDGDLIEFTVRKSKPTNTEETPVLIASSIYSITNGIANVFLAPMQTNISIGKYWYDLRIKYQDGRVDTVVEPNILNIKTSINNNVSIKG